MFKWSSTRVWVCATSRVVGIHEKTLCITCGRILLLFQPDSSNISPLEIVFPSLIRSQLAIDGCRLLIVLLDGSAFLFNNPSAYLERKSNERTRKHSIRPRAMNGFEAFREIAKGNVEYVSRENLSQVVIMEEEEEEEEEETGEKRSTKSRDGVSRLSISFPIHVREFNMNHGVLSFLHGTNGIGMFNQDSICSAERDSLGTEDILPIIFPFHGTAYIHHIHRLDISHMDAAWKDVLHKQFIGRCPSTEKMGEEIWFTFDHDNCIRLHQIRDGCPTCLASYESTVEGAMLSRAYTKNVFKSFYHGIKCGDGTLSIEDEMSRSSSNMCFAIVAFSRSGDVVIGLPGERTVNWHVRRLYVGIKQVLQHDNMFLLLGEEDKTVYTLQFRVTSTDVQEHKRVTHLCIPFPLAYPILDISGVKWDDDQRCCGCVALLASNGAVACISDFSTSSSTSRGIISEKILSKAINHRLQMIENRQETVQKVESSLNELEGERKEVEDVIVASCSSSFESDRMKARKPSHMTVTSEWDDSLPFDPASIKVTVDGFASARVVSSQIHHTQSPWTYILEGSRYRKRHDGKLVMIGTTWNQFASCQLEESKRERSVRFRGLDDYPETIRSFLICSTELHVPRCLIDCGCCAIHPIDFLLPAPKGDGWKNVSKSDQKKVCIRVEEGSPGLVDVILRHTPPHRRSLLLQGPFALSAITPDGTSLKIQWDANGREYVMQSSHPEFIESVVAFYEKRIILEN